jgi:hypothetical protein
MPIFAGERSELSNDQPLFDRCEDPLGGGGFDEAKRPPLSDSDVAGRRVGTTLAADDDGGARLGSDLIGERKRRQYDIADSPPRICDHKSAAAVWRVPDALASSSITRYRDGWPCPHVLGAS